MSITSGNIETNACASEMNNVKYPESFYDTKENVHVTEDTIQGMVEDALCAMEREQLDNVSISTGNALVLVTKVHEEDGGGMHVVVAENYKEYYINNEVLSK